MLPINSAGKNNVKHEISTNTLKKKNSESRSIHEKISERIDSIFHKADILAAQLNSEEYLPLVGGRFCVATMLIDTNKTCPLQKDPNNVQCNKIKKAFKYKIIDVIEEDWFELDSRIPHLIRDHHILSKKTQYTKDLIDFFQVGKPEIAIDAWIEVVYSISELTDEFFYLPMTPEWIRPGSIPVYELTDCIPIDENKLKEHKISAEQISGRLLALIAKAEKLLKKRMKDEIPLVEGSYFIQKSEKCIDPRLPGTNFIQYCATDFINGQQIIFASFIPEMILKHGLCGVGEYKIDLQKTIEFLRLGKEAAHAIEFWEYVDEDFSKPSVDELNYAEFVKSKKMTIDNGIEAYLIDGLIAEILPCVVRDGESGTQMLKNLKSKNKYLYIVINNNYLDCEEKPVELFDAKLKHVLIPGSCLFKICKDKSDKLKISDMLVDVKKSIVSDKGSIIELAETSL